MHHPKIPQPPQESNQIPMIDPVAPLIVPHHQARRLECPGADAPYGSIPPLGFDIFGEVVFGLVKHVGDVVEDGELGAPGGEFDGFCAAGEPVAVAFWVGACTVEEDGTVWWVC